MDIDKLLRFSSHSGKLMLQSGGETHRVEETISRIYKSFDINEVDVYSIVKRITSRGIDLNMVQHL